MGDSRKSRTTGENRPFAKRSLGQNFLVDRNAIERIIAALDISDADAVIEIGPGRGALTRELLKQGARLAAVEKDDRLSEALRVEFAEEPGFSIVCADVLETDLRSIAKDLGDSRTMKLAANLPYNISTPVIRLLARQREVFGTIVLMLQKEVADRITAPAGSTARGFISVLVERAFVSEKLFDVPPSSFRPVPKVRSTVIRLIPKKPVSGRADESDFEELVSAGFMQKRKTLRNNLDASGSIGGESLAAAGGSERLLKDAGIAPMARAEELSLDSWEALARILFPAGHRR